jgi:GH15 family glucan-1,4-alpha-glucosidase
MPTRRIEDFAMIGDCETAALVGRDGNIEWLCWPNFASDACFASLLGSTENGHWSLSPTRKSIGTTRRYLPHTLILETTVQVSGGKVVITDFMPIRGKHSDLIRVVYCTAGKVTMNMELRPSFHYGSTVPWIAPLLEEGGDIAWVAKAGPDLVVLRTDIPLIESTPGSLSATFTLHHGERQDFSLTYGCSFEEVPPPIKVQQEFEGTKRFWTDWAAKSTYLGEYREAVERSLITLKALTYRPSGAIVAASTTSLPERVGGPLNWDYRYCWIRDATLTLSALVDAGYTEEIIAWKQWLIRTVGHDASQIQIMYGIAGERHIADWEASWLGGYEKSTPVCIGNAAQSQLQQDIYGEIASALFHAREAGIPCEPEELKLQQTLTEHLTKIWREPGSGMWEERGKPQRFTYSVAMAWLAFERGVRSIEEHGMGGPVAAWRTLRDLVRDDVEKHGYNNHIDSFVQHYGSRDLDASVLLLPIVGFVQPDDPRMVSTVKAIEGKLMKDGLLLRNIPKSNKAQQGAFLACSFWLVEVYAMQGRARDARALFEKVLGLANDVGLLSEEYDTNNTRLVGNFPQAFSHIALVRAAMHLARSAD